MQSYAHMQNRSPKIFKRSVGISRKTFRRLLKKIAKFIAHEKKDNPLKQRGKKSSISLADKILLTFYYLRDYPSFLKLGQSFGISQSSAQKIFQRFSSILLKLVKIENKQALVENTFEAIAIDVTEQPIERPKKNRKPIILEKKNDIPLKFN